MKPVRMLLVVTGMLILSISAWGGIQKTISATIFNQDSLGNAYALQSDGTSSALYKTGAGVDSDLTPIKAINGTVYFQWDLDLSHSSRSFYLTLSPLNGSPIVFAGSMAFNGQLYSRCFTSSGGYQNWTLIQPQYPDTNCAMRVNFTYNGTGYSLVMSPEQTGTGTATVTCTNWSTSSKSCVAWTDVPTGGSNANVANLYSGSTLVGQYLLSFKITLTNP